MKKKNGRRREHKRKVKHNIQGTIVHRFYDFYGEQKKNFHFTIHAYSELIKKILEFHEKEFKEVIFWSDGGLKTKELLYYLSKINLEYTLSTLFQYFAPYHGNLVN